MTDRAWKQEERHVARLLGGTRYPANSGGRVDCESAQFVAQVKHVKALSLAELERLALEIASIAQRRNKCGLVVLKRKAGKGQKTPHLICMTEEVWRRLRRTSLPGGNAECGEKEGGSPLPTRQAAA